MPLMCLSEIQIDKSGSRRAVSPSEIRRTTLSARPVRVWRRGWDLNPRWT